MEGFFFGRRAELERLAALVREPVAVIYGLPGIGKSEIAHRAVAELLARPEYAGVSPLVVTAHAELAGNLHGFLLARLTGRSAAEPLAPLLDALTRERHVVVIDDAHVVAAEVAALVDGLARRLDGKCRLIATGREELPIETTPIVVRLGPLDDREAIELATHLAARLGVVVDDLAGLAERSGGSPLILRHLLVGRGRAADDPIRAAVAALDDETLHHLARLASVAGCSQSRVVAERLVGDDQALRALSDRFLVDASPDRVVVHGLVRDAVIATADPEVVRSARLLAADVLWEEYRRRLLPLLAVEAICLSVSVGEVDAAMVRLREASRTIAGAGLEHLLLPIVERIAAGGHADAGLLAGRLYLRMGRIEAAARALDTASGDSTNAWALATRAAIAERLCDLDAASTLLRAAIAGAGPGRGRELFRLRLAAVRALAGDDIGASALLATVTAASDALGDGDQARIWWVRAIVASLHQRWGEAERAVGEGRRAAARAEAQDLDYLLLLLDLLAACEGGDIARIDASVAQVELAQPSQPLRERMTDLYVGIAQLARGQVVGALETLQRAYHQYDRMHDVLLASVAGHYLGRARLVAGDAHGATEVLGAVARRARSCGLGHLVGPGEAYLARALLSVGRVEEAARLAAGWLASDNPFVAGIACAVDAFAAAFAGDLAAGRMRLAAALAQVGDAEPARGALVLDQAELELLGGDPERARLAARAVLDDPRRGERSYARARAHLVLGAVELAAGQAADALVALAEAEAIAKEIGARHLGARVAALRVASGPGGGGFLDQVPVEHRPGYLGLLRVLGVRSDTVVVTSATGRIYTDAAAVGPLARRFDLLIDASTGAFYGRAGGRVDGRGTAAAIVVALAEAVEPLSAERLHHLVWGGPDYHPLRHRNTLYIALNRTRKVFLELGESREVILRDSTGWSINREIDLAIARRDPRNVSAITISSTPHAKTK